MPTRPPAARPRALWCSVAATLIMLGGAADTRLAAEADLPGVSVGGDVARPFTLTVADLKTMPRTTVTVSEGGRSNVFEGVLIAEVLKRAGAPLGDKQGPIRLVAPHDQRAARSVRMLRRLDVVRLRP